MVHLHNGVLTIQQKIYDILQFARKWIELEEIILSEVTQTQKYEHGNIPTHRQISAVKKNDKEPIVHDTKEAM